MIKKEIAEIVLKSKKIVVVGASRDENKAAHLVPKYLQSQGYTIIPVNPFANKILGEKAYNSLEDITEEIDIVDVFRPSEETPEIVKKAIALKPKLIWLQLGIKNDKAKKIAEKEGVKFVQDKCMKIEHTALMKEKQH